MRRLPVRGVAGRWRALVGPRVAVKQKERNGS